MSYAEKMALLRLFRWVRSRSNRLAAALCGLFASLERRPIPVGHLRPKDVVKLLKIVEPSEPIIVGGQAINIWAEHYSARSPALRRLGPLTSKDVDFYRNREAALRLVEELAGKLREATLDDATPNAAVVVLTIDGRSVEIDFMNSILGVDEKTLLKRRVKLSWRDPQNGNHIAIFLMHPMDCVLSRLENINGFLHRSDQFALNQMTASVVVLELFLDELLSAGSIREAQRLLVELGKVSHKKHIGKATHLTYNIDLTSLMERFLNEARFDERWRRLILAKSIRRSKDLALKYAA